MNIFVSFTDTQCFLLLMIALFSYPIVFFIRMAIDAYNFKRTGSKNIEQRW